MSNKKEARKENRKAVFSNVAEGKEFWASNGLIVRNLNELASALGSMEEYHFSQHVNADKNDFAQWVSDVYGQKELAENLGQSKSLNEHEVITLKHLVNMLK